MKFKDKFYDIFDHNKCPPSETEDKKCISKKSDFHQILPTYWAYKLMTWCQAVMPVKPSCQGSQALKVVKLSSQKLSCQSSQPAKQSIASIVHICTCYMNNVFIIILFNGGKMKANVREQWMNWELIMCIMSLLSLKITGYVFFSLNKLINLY